MKSREFVKSFRIAEGNGFRIKDFDPAETLGLKSKEHAQESLDKGIAQLSDRQEKLYAQDRWAILIIRASIRGSTRSSLRRPAARSSHIWSNWLN